MDRPPITHVAVRFRGQIYSLPPPNRHHHVLWMIWEQTGAKTIEARGEDQGFLDAGGNYLTRKQALVRAKLHGQIKSGHPTVPHELYSEDVW